MFAGSHNINLVYDEKSVEFLDNFINESGAKYNEKQKEKLIDFLGSFLGECIRRNYGGRWEIINNDSAVRFDEKNAVFPFNKIKKQFENGAEDSILSFYQVIPLVFKINK
jgi:hypothetical protein